MPVYTFTCKCGHTFKDLAKAKEQAKCSKCGTLVDSEMPSQATTFTMDTLDKYKGRQMKKGNEKQLKARMRKHHDKYEVAEKIDKEGLDEAKRHGWLGKIKKL